MPGTQVTIGPVIENGFYYDFAERSRSRPTISPKIEEKMREIIAARRALHQRGLVDRDKAKELFAEKGEDFKVELIDAIPEGEDLKIYRQGDWLDLCRGPHMTSTGKVGKAFKLHARSPAPIGAAIPTNAAAPAHLRHGLGHERGPRRLSSCSSRRPRSATTAGSAARWTCSTSRRRRRASVFWHPKGWTLFQALIAYMRRRQDAGGYVEVNSPDMMERTLWEQSGHWEKFGENMFVTETPRRARLLRASR